MAVKEHSIFVVDDDDDDIELLRSTLEDLGYSFNLNTASNAFDAITRLQVLDSDNQLPCIIVLDLNLPVMEGKALYEFIKNNKSLASIPIAVLTSSNNKVDKEYFAHKASYFVKPYSVENLYTCAQKIIECCSGHASGLVHTNQLN
jgi:CheY-like chemotaxis protein